MAKKVLISLTNQQLEEVDKMVKAGLYASRSEAMRDALRQLVEAKIKRIEMLARESARITKGKSLVKTIVKEHKRE